MQNWRIRKDYYLFILFVPLFFIAAHAGGLAIAAVTAIFGVISLIGLRPIFILEQIKKSPLAIWALLGLLVWGCVSSLWSPYVSNRRLPNPFILLIGVPLFLLMARNIFVLGKLNSQRLRTILIWSTIVSTSAIFIDLASGYSISLAVDPVSGSEEFESRRGDLIQNIGHGVSVLALVFPVVAIMLWRRGKQGKTLAILLAVLIFICTHLASVSASSLALAAAITIMAIASVRTDFAIKAAFFVAALSLILAPLIALIVTKLSAEQLATLPFSWEERIHNWRFVFERILEHPFMGHGFDAVRTFADKHTIRGFENRAIVSLHPHNAGLHIWVELGAIGIALATSAIYLAYRQVTSLPTLSKNHLIAICGVIIAAAVNSSLTYGVWQDWWWATLIVSCAFVSLIRTS